MGLNRDKFRKIVGGITTTEPEQPLSEDSTSPAVSPETDATPPIEQGRERVQEAPTAEERPSANHRRFAKRGRPKSRKEEAPVSKVRKVKVSLFLSEFLVNDLYDWAHEDRIHPGEMFERALKPFHEKEAKRRNGGKG